MITYKKHAVFAINKNTMNIWSRWQKPIHFPTFVKHVLGKPLGAISAVQMEFCQIAFQPPPPQANGPFGATFFAEN